MRLVVAPEAELDADLRRQVTALQEQAWPGGGGHDPALTPVTLLLVDGNVVVGGLDVLSKPLTHDSRRFAASGISAMVVDPARRRQGHGVRLAAAAQDVMRTAGADLGLFTCDRPLASFYAAAGWQQLPGTVLVAGTPSDPFPSDQPGFDKVTMAAFFTPLALAARDTFVGARVALHPGEIDRLW